VITYAKVALALLQLAKMFADWGRSRADFSAGEDAAIGRAANEVLAVTTWGNKIAEKIDAMDRDALDGLVDALGADEPLAHEPPAGAR
jgi:hypothetical protein